MEERGRGLETVQALFERADRRGLLDFLNTAHPADIAQILRELPLERQVGIFRLLTAHRAGEVLSELDDQTLLESVARRLRIRLGGPSRVSRDIHLFFRDEHAVEPSDRL